MVKKPPEAGSRGTLDLVPVASGCQILTILPYSRRFYVIEWRGNEGAIHPYFTGIY
jgi:hypothetical protein